MRLSLTFFFSVSSCRCVFLCLCDNRCLLPSRLPAHLSACPPARPPTLTPCLSACICLRVLRDAYYQHNTLLFFTLHSVSHHTFFPTLLPKPPTLSSLHPSHSTHLFLSFPIRPFLLHTTTHQTLHTNCSPPPRPCTRAPVSKIPSQGCHNVE